MVFSGHMLGVLGLAVIMLLVAAAVSAPADNTFPNGRIGLPFLIPPLIVVIAIHSVLIEYHEFGDKRFTRSVDEAERNAAALAARLAPSFAGR